MEEKINIQARAERLASLGIMGDQLREDTPSNPSILCFVMIREVSGALNITQREGEKEASLSGSYTSDR